MSSTQLDRISTPRTPAAQVSQATAVEQARAAAEVQAAVIVAQNVPRDMAAAQRQMAEACGSPALARKASYSVPRKGSANIVGPSVHLARELARCFGNVQYGVTELRRDDVAGLSEMQSWAWDVQNNTRAVRSFIVPHQRMVKGNRVDLTDLTDVLYNNSNFAARALRESIFSILPAWFVDDAKDRCAATLANGGGVPLAQRITTLIDNFGGLGVGQPQLEDRVGKPAGQWTPLDLGQLEVIGGAIHRGEAVREDEFPEPERPERRTTAADIVSGYHDATSKRGVFAGRQAPTQSPSPIPPGEGTQSAGGEPAGEAGEPPVDTPGEPQRLDTGSRRAKRMFVLLGEQVGEDQRLAYCSWVVGREVTTSKDLWTDEAEQIIEALEAGLIMDGQPS